MLSLSLSLIILLLRGVRLRRSLLLLEQTIGQVRRDHLRSEDAHMAMV
jgi:hypothetical protein